ncbi:MAG: hypothetical protein ACOYXS_08715 [Chloroflexota bacterium]
MSVVSQRVTKVDLANGRIRLPHEAKALFLVQRTYVSVVLRGQPMTVRYDPRMGPDRERSAVLGIGRGVLSDLVGTDEVLEISARPDGTVELG